MLSAKSQMHIAKWKKASVYPLRAEFLPLDPSPMKFFKQHLSLGFFASAPLDMDEESRWHSLNKFLYKYFIQITMDLALEISDISLEGIHSLFEGMKNDKFMNSLGSYTLDFAKCTVTLILFWGASNFQAFHLVLLFSATLKNCLVPSVVP